MRPIWIFAATVNWIGAAGNLSLVPIVQTRSDLIACLLIGSLNLALATAVTVALLARAVKP